MRLGLSGYSRGEEERRRGGEEDEERSEREEVSTGEQSSCPLPLLSRSEELERRVALRRARRLATEASEATSDLRRARRVGSPTC